MIIYLLNATGLTPGVSSTVHIWPTYKQYTEHTMTQNTQNGTYITIRILKLTKEYIT